LSGVFSKGFYQNKRLDPIHFKLTQPFSKVASCSVSIREFCDFTNCWLTDIVISRPTNQPQNSLHDALSSEKKISQLFSASLRCQIFAELVGSLLSSQMDNS
jgi:hypothetical protein